MTRRFRPRFSVRTFAIFVTLVCVYFGTWEITKRYGVPDLRLRGMARQQPVSDASWMKAGSPMPFVTWKEQIDVIETGKLALVIHREYSFWFFGGRLKLFESDHEPLPATRWRKPD